MTVPPLLVQRRMISALANAAGLVEKLTASGGRCVFHPLRSLSLIPCALTSSSIAWRPMKANVGVKMLGAVIVFGLAILTFGLSRSFELSLVALHMLCGAFDEYVLSSELEVPVGLEEPDAVEVVT